MVTMGKAMVVSRQPVSSFSLGRGLGVLPASLVLSGLLHRTLPEGWVLGCTSRSLSQLAAEWANLHHSWGVEDRKLQEVRLPQFQSTAGKIK